MLKQILTPLSIFALLALGCNKTANSGSASAQKSVSESDAYAAFQKNKGDGKTFGAKVTPDGAVSYDDILSKMGKNTSLKNVKVTGTVETVCKAKGCWMNISSEKGASSLFVKFKDYAFFMPKDIAGKKVVMVGDVFKEVTSVEELRHFAEDEHKSAADIAKITQPKEDVKFMANGVLIIE